MKKLNTILLLFFLFLTPVLKSQSYSRFVNENSVWQLGYSWEGAFLPFGWMIGKDTLIDTIYYHELLWLDLSPEQINGNYGLESIELAGWIREDTTTRQVFIRPTDPPNQNLYFNENCDGWTEKLVLDFSLEIGDTIKTCNTFLEESLPCVIDTIYFEHIWGKERRVFECRPEYGWEKLVEGVGYWRGPFEFGSHIPQTLNWSLWLQKYCDASLGMDCGLLPVGIREPSGASKIILSPNPAYGTIKISVPEPISMVYLFDGRGGMVRSWPFNGNTDLSLDLSDISTGIYILKAVGLNKGNWVEKLMVLNK